MNYNIQQTTSARINASI